MGKYISEEENEEEKEEEGEDGEEEDEDGENRKEEYEEDEEEDEEDKEENRKQDEEDIDNEDKEEASLVPSLHRSSTDTQVLCVHISWSIPFLTQKTARWLKSTTSSFSVTSACAICVQQLCYKWGWIQACHMIKRY